MVTFFSLKEALVVQIHSRQPKFILFNRKVQSSSMVEQLTVNISAAFCSNAEVNRPLIRGNLNSQEHGNPELGAIRV
jgi:hypothetical protein